MKRYRKGDVVYRSFNLVGQTGEVTKSLKRDLKPLYKSGNVSGKTFQFVGTKEIVDRDGDIVRISGMDLTHFKTNPIVLWGHDASELPVGKVVGLYHDVTNKELIFEIQFGKTSKAKDVESLVEDEILNTTSIGFIVKDWDYNEEVEAYEFTETELFEISIVNIPANPAATAVKESEEDEVVSKSLSKEEIMEIINTSIAEAMASKEEPEEAKEEVTDEVKEEAEVAEPEPVIEPEEEKEETGSIEADKVEQPEGKDELVSIMSEIVNILTDMRESNKPAEQEENTETDSQEPIEEPKESEYNQQTDEESSDETQDEDHSKESPETPEDTDEETSVEVEDIEEIEDDEIIFVLQ